jgi:tripartite-type tricarboxylate transporter receptor subunit TctC
MKAQFGGVHRTSCMQVLVALAATLGVLHMGAQAQDYPAKPVRIIVPLVPGGPNDLSVRPLAPKLQDLLGQPFILDYRAGANGKICSLSARRCRALAQRRDRGQAAASMSYIPAAT